jgi:hypothetical protein
MEGPELDKGFEGPSRLVIISCFRCVTKIQQGRLERRALLASLVSDQPYAAHPGVAKTVKSIQRYYWWPRMWEEVKVYVNTCDSCQRVKASNAAPAGLLQPLPVPHRPWESISMDYIMDLPECDGHDAILTFVDRFTKMVHFRPTQKSSTSLDAAMLFVSTIVANHGTPLEVVSDRDTRFTSHLYTDLCTLMSMRQKLSTAFHPQTDGQTEIYNRVLEDCLRHYVNASQTDWVRYLPLVEFAVNNSYNASVSSTPFFLNYGFHPLDPMSLQFKDIASTPHITKDPSFPDVLGTRRGGGRCPAALRLSKHIHHVWQQVRLALASSSK